MLLFGERCLAVSKIKNKEALRQAFLLIIRPDSLLHPIFESPQRNDRLRYQWSLMEWLHMYPGISVVTGLYLVIKTFNISFPSLQAGTHLYFNSITVILALIAILLSSFLQHGSNKYLQVFCCGCYRDTGHIPTFA